MSQQSSDQLSRFRWTVVLLASAAGLYAAIRLYNSQRPATTLRRSNAVHRQRVSHLLGFKEPTPGAPFGTIHFKKHNDETMSINLATTQLPSADMLRDRYGSDYEMVLRASQKLAYRLVISAAVDLIHHTDGLAVMRDHGFHDLVSAMANRDEDAMIRASDVVLEAMHLDTLDLQQVHEILEAIPSTNTWTNGSNSEDSEDRDLAETEEDWDTERAETGQGLRGLLYYIAENDAQRKAYEHRGIRCEECGDLPIRGVRWHCLNCPDYDLCSSCEAHTRHVKTHVFAKIKIPVPVLSQPTKEVKLWYPGDPQRIHPPLSLPLKQKLCQDYEYEESQMDAMYDQFTCLANVPWEQDPKKVKAAIDRRAFNKALTSDRWPAGLATNVMYDRMFAFYDTDNNGIIGFSEFVDGMAYLRGPKRFASLRRAIQGHDLDGDGYVNRADFLRLLRAKHIIQQQLISDQVEYHESERIQASMEILRSNQPISSTFTEAEIPQGQTRRPRGKQPDALGDLLPLPTTRAVLSDQDPFVQQRPAREQLRGMLSRFDEHIASQATGAGRREDSSHPMAAVSVDDALHTGSEKYMFGYALCPKIQAILHSMGLPPAWLARKITGMLLKQDNAYLLGLTTNDDALREAVEQAVRDYEEHIRTHSENCVACVDSVPGDEHRDELILSEHRGGLVHPEEEDALDPYMQDIVWQVQESGFNELLNPLFAAREEEDAEIVDTRAERMRWATEINDAVEAEAQSRARLMSAATVVQQSRRASDPDGSGGLASGVSHQSALRPESVAPDRATHGSSSHGQRDGATDAELFTEAYSRRRRQVATRTDLVATDWQSLERREAQIADAPLEDLLDILGAGIRAASLLNDEDEAASNARIAHSDSSTIWNGVPADRATSPLKTATTSDDSADPTLPQNRPNTTSSEDTFETKLSGPIKTADEKVPSKARLNQLARLSDLEREMKKRGGPGRLAYDEVEHIVIDGGHSELRGLVKAWLEWASF